MRKSFDTELQRLNDMLINMGTLCEQAIAVCVSIALDEDDTAEDIKTLQERAFALEGETDRAEREIEALCMRILLRRQPVSGDLRVVSSALKMISDMERIGDQAADIAELSEFIRDIDPAHRLHLRRMAREAVKMVTAATEAFVRKDEAAARAVIEYDDVIDELFVQVKRELIGRIAAAPAEGEAYLDLLMAAKYLERVGDHAANIAEWVEYSVTGRHPDSQ